MAVAKQKAKSSGKKGKPKAAQAPKVPEVPEVVQTDEFHLPLQDNSPGTIRSNNRLMKIVLLGIGLLVLGVILILVLHDNPVPN